MPFEWSESTPLGKAVEYLRETNQAGKRKLGEDAPLEWVPQKWQRCVFKRGSDGTEISRPHYELALLSTLIEKLKSGDVTVRHSRRWADFEEYLISKDEWKASREQHYAALGVPTDPEAYLQQLDERLDMVTRDVNKGVPKNEALTVDQEKGEWRLAPLRANSAQLTAKHVKALIERRLPPKELADIVIDLDQHLNLLGHFLHDGDGSRLPQNVRRRNPWQAKDRPNRCGLQHRPDKDGRSFGSQCA